jgi:hypothetical protein
MFAHFVLDKKTAVLRYLLLRGGAMEYTIGFYDDFDHLMSRAAVYADDELNAISLAAKQTNTQMTRVGRIELTSSDREWLARLDAEPPCQPA